MNTLTRARLTAILVLVGSAAAHAAPDPDVFDPFFRYTETEHKVFFTELPGETVDPFTGTLRINHLDFQLQGKAGLDLQIIRTYSSKIWDRSEEASRTFLAENAHSVLGYGWVFHMGRLQNPNAVIDPQPCGAVSLPVYEAPDGSARVFYPVANFNALAPIFVSRDFWRLETRCTELAPNGNSGACMWSDKGIRYDFSNSTGNVIQPTANSKLMWPVSRIVDTVANEITVAYRPQNKPFSGGAVQSITDTYGRAITFAYDDTAQDGLRLETMTVNNKVYSYCYTKVEPSQTEGSVDHHRLPGNDCSATNPSTPCGREFLTEFRSPNAGPCGGAASGLIYRYAYYGIDAQTKVTAVAKNQYGLRQVTYPQGGTSTYVYDSKPFFTGRETLQIPVVTSRTLAGRDIPAGALWSYDYDSPPAGTAMQTATITRPDGKRDVHTLFGFGRIAQLNGQLGGHTWRAGLTQSISYADGKLIEDFDWEPKGASATNGVATPIVISGAPFLAPVYASACGAPNVSWDNQVRAAVLRQRKITVSGRDYVTDYLGIDAFGQAGTVSETGQQARTTTRTFFADTRSGGSGHNVVRDYPTSERVCIGTDCFNKSWSYYMDALRFALKSTETLRGVTTVFDYHTASAERGNIRTITNAANQTLTFTSYENGIAKVASYNGAFTHRHTPSFEGWLLDETDGKGNKTGYEYDGIGRLTKVTPPPGSVPGGNTITSYVYTNSISASTVKMEHGSYIETSTLDGLGRTIRTEASIGVVTSSRYDNMGRKIFVSYPRDSSSCTGSCNTVEAGTFTSYDELDRPTSIKSGCRFRPASNDCDPSSPDMSTTTNTWAATGPDAVAGCMTTTVTRATGDAPATKRCFTSFGDPGERRLDSVLDANNKSWSYAHTTFGDVKTFTAPLAQGNRSYTHSATSQFLSSTISGEAGTTTYTPEPTTLQIRTRTDARNVVATFGYDNPVTMQRDPLSRLRTIRYGTAATPDDVKQAFDNASNLASLETTNGGAFTFTHDEMNRPATQRWSIAGHDYDTRAIYDKNGCLTDLEYPTGIVVKMTCDTANRPTTIAVRRGSASFQIVGNTATPVKYHPNGRVRSMRFPNKISTDFTFDDRGRIKNSIAGVVVDLAYQQYDGADNLKQMTLRGSTRTMTYDSLDRLETTSGPWGSLTYTYDELGNRKTVPGANPFGFNLGSTTFTYSATRNVVQGHTRTGGVSLGPSVFPRLTLTWDAAGRLATSSDGASYKYDGRGRRVRKDESGNRTTLYHYDFSGRLIAETSVTGEAQREYIYLGDTLVAGFGCFSGAPPCVEQTWYHTDMLGSVLARTSARGTVVARLDYLPWGETWQTSGNPDHRRYNGRVFDPGTGFYDYGARQYWPALARFIGPDSSIAALENPQTVNPYSYVLNNPYKYTDPSGRVPFLVVTAGIGAIVGAGIAAWATYDPNTGTVNWAAVGAGFVGGAMIGAGVGAVSGTVFAGSATASTGAVVQGAVGWAAAALGVGAKAANEAEARWNPNPDRVGHIFRNVQGHVVPGSVEEAGQWARIFQWVTGNPSNLRPDAVQAGIISQDAARAGVQAFTSSGANMQIWVTTRGGDIINAGVNRVGEFR